MLPKLEDVTLIEPPDYGKPRSLSLKEPAKVDLETLEAVVPAKPAAGMMSGRRENTVHTEDCDDRGRLRERVEDSYLRENGGEARLPEDSPAAD